MNHHNRDYDGGSPNIPLAIGDRYYAQDLVRDGWFATDQATRSLWRSLVAPGELGSAGLLLSIDGLIAKGTGDTLNVPAGRGLAWYQVRVPDAFPSIPPTSKLEDITTPVDWPAQSNMAIPSATLDGVSVNYIKARYAEVDGNSRQRAKKSGTYAYERIPSRTFTVDTTSPDKYDVVLGTLVGTTGNFTITTVGPYYFPIVPGASVAAGDLVELRSSGKIKKYKKMRLIAEDWSPGSFSGVRPKYDRIDDNRFIATYMVSATAYGICVLVLNEDDTVTTAGAISLLTGTDFNAGCRVVMLTSTTGVVVYRNGTTSIMGIAFTVSAGNVITLGSPTTIVTVNTNGTGFGYPVERVDDTRGVTVYTDTTPNAYAVAFSVSGLAISPGSAVQLWAGSSVGVFHSVKMVSHGATAYGYALSSASSTTITSRSFSITNTVITMGTQETMTIPTLGLQIVPTFVIEEAADSEKLPGVGCCIGYHTTPTTAMGRAIWTFSVRVEYVDLDPRKFSMTHGKEYADTDIRLALVALEGKLVFMLYSSMTLAGTDGNGVYTGHIIGRYRGDRIEFLYNVAECADILHYMTIGYVKRNSWQAILLHTKNGGSYYENVELASLPTRVIGIAADSSGRVIQDGQRYYNASASWEVGRLYYMDVNGNIATSGDLKIGRAISAKEILVDLEMAV